MIIPVLISAGVLGVIAVFAPRTPSSPVTPNSLPEPSPPRLDGGGGTYPTFRYVGDLAEARDVVRVDTPRVPGLPLATSSTTFDMIVRSTDVENLSGTLLNALIPPTLANVTLPRSFVKELLRNGEVWTLVNGTVRTRPMTAAEVFLVQRAQLGVPS